MSSAQQQQQQQLAPTPAVTTTTTTPSSSSSVLGKGHVEEENAVEAVVARNGLVSLRQGEREVQEREREQRLGLRPGQVGEETVQAMEKEGEAQAQVQGEVLAPEQNSLDAQVDWTTPVEWIGTVRERNVAGADVGNRLYAGKKRMFKGHKWERMRERRVGRTEMLLRDMDKRIERFKGVRSIFYSTSSETHFFPFFSLPPPLPPFFFSF
jgi:Mitochondrial ribosomal protein mL59